MKQYITSGYKSVEAEGKKSAWMGRYTFWMLLSLGEGWSTQGRGGGGMFGTSVMLDSWEKKKANLNQIERMFALDAARIRGIGGVCFLKFSEFLNI